MCAAFACLSLGAAAAADDLVRFGVDRVTLGWDPPEHGLAHGYVVMLSTNGGFEAYHDTVLEPRITLEGQPWDVLVARIRTLGQAQGGGPVIVSPPSPPSQLIRFIPAPMWSGDGLLGLHCASCASLQLRSIGNQTPATEVPGRPAPWRLLGIDTIDTAPGYDALWQDDVSGALEVTQLPDGAGSPSAATDTLGPFTALGLAEIDGTGSREIVVQRSPDALEFWGVEGGAIVQVGEIPALPGWNFVKAANADGDARDEIWWQTPVPGRVQVWKVDLAGNVRVLSMTDTPAAGALVEVADFDGDGEPDALWRDAAGRLTITYLTGGGVLKGSYDVPPFDGDADLRVRGVANVDGVPGFEIVLQDQRTYRVLAILPLAPPAAQRRAMFDVERRFELMHVR